MEKSEPMDIQAFDIALFNLYKAVKISLDEALKNADAECNLRLKIELAAKGDSVKSGGKKDENASLSLIAEEIDEGDEAESMAAFK